MSKTSIICVFCKNTIFHETSHPPCVTDKDSIKYHKPDCPIRELYEVSADRFTEEKDKTRGDMSTIDKIQFIRTKNNQAWMDILRLAVLHAPTKAKQIMSEITENDRQINELMKGLIE